MAEAEAIRRKRDVLAAELYAYFWLTSNELTARGTEAMLRLPPFVLRDLAVELQGFEAVTNRANQRARHHVALATDSTGAAVRALFV